MLFDSGVEARQVPLTKANPNAGKFFAEETNIRKSEEAEKDKVRHAVKQRQTA